MGIPIQNPHVYSLNFADDQVLITQDHDDMEFTARKLKEEYEKWGLTMNLEKTKTQLTTIYIYIYIQPPNPFSLNVQNDDGLLEAETCSC